MAHTRIVTDGVAERDGGGSSGCLPSWACPQAELPSRPPGPRVEVIVFRPLDNTEWPGLSFGRADEVTAYRALRGLVSYRGGYAPGF